MFASPEILGSITNFLSIGEKYSNLNTAPDYFVNLSSSNTASVLASKTRTLT